MILDWRSGGLQCPPRRDGIGDITGPHSGERLAGVGGYLRALIQQGTIEIKNDQCHPLETGAAGCHISTRHALNAL